MEDDPTTYFGLYSAKQNIEVATLLNSLNVAFYFTKSEQTEERLKNWGAWDPLAPDPFEGSDLYIYDRDVEKVGTKLVELNRISGNANDGLP